MMTPADVITTIDEQSRDIALGVDKALEAKENRMSEDEMDAIGCRRPGNDVWLCRVI
ncbi:MAG: hypothetical protein ACLR0U_16370 [Enterocloster clostridioformis]